MASVAKSTDALTATAINEKIAGVIQHFDTNRSYLISILQAVQEAVGYLPAEAFPLIARHLGVAPSEVYGVATFYAQFRLHPSARYEVRVCSGTACHVRGGARISEAVSRELNLLPGETSADLEHSLEKVPCFGSCSLAPVMVVNSTVYGRLTAGKARQILATLQ